MVRYQIYKMKGEETGRGKLTKWININGGTGLKVSKSWRK
jgi:hypothetical protein